MNVVKLITEATAARIALEAPIVVSLLALAAAVPPAAPPHVLTCSPLPPPQM